MARLLIFVAIALFASGCGQDPDKKRDQERIEQHQQEQMKRMG